MTLSAIIRFVTQGFSPAIFSELQMRTPAAFVALLLTCVDASSADQLDGKLPKDTYPETKRIDVTEQHFGQTIVDPYRWLENSGAEDGAVRSWIEAQNAVTRAYLDTLPGRDHFRKRMTELLDYDRYTVPRKRGDRYFFNVIKGNENQPSLYVREGVLGDSRVLIDPNSWSEDGADALSIWNASDDGRLVAFGKQTGGTDWRTIRVLDVDSGKILDDVVEWARFTRQSQSMNRPQRSLPTTPSISTGWAQTKPRIASSTPGLNVLNCCTALTGFRADATSPSLRHLERTKAPW
jgi:hypothetical protein